MEVRNNERNSVVNRLMIENKSSDSNKNLPHFADNQSFKPERKE